MDSINSGQFIGRYAIQKTLGAGAMGVVYLARDPHIERLLAIKTVRLQGGSPAEIADRKQRLLRETKTAGSLIHPHVVTLFDAGEHEDQLFIAFEYVDGSSLGEKLAAEGVPKLGEALRIAREAAEGLGYAHTRGIVHRDVKPANILISSAGQVKVADFGIAKVVGQATELTVTGTVVGSPHYLSPEQVRGEPLDGRSDVFSLGVVFYELLGGTRPFDGETFTTLLYQILHQEPPPIRLKPALVPTVADVLRRMLAKDRNQRYADGNEAAKALAELARNLSPELLASPAVADTHVEPTRLFSTEEISSVMPPPLPPSIGEAATLPAGGPPPPPRPPTSLAPPAPPVAPPRPPAGAGVARSSNRGKWIAAIVGGIVVLGLGAVVAVYLLSRVLGLGTPKPPDGPATTVTESLPATPDPVRPEPTVHPSPAPSNRPVEAEPPPSNVPRPTPPAPQLGRPFENRPTPVRDAVQERVEERRQPAPEPVPSRTEEPAEPTVDEEPVEPEPTPSAPVAVPPNAIQTGMKIFFTGFPDDDDDPPIFAVVDGRNIGKVTDYTNKRPYELPDPGVHRLKITGSGYEKVFTINAAEGRSPTPFSYTGPGRGGVQGPGGEGGGVWVKRGVRFDGPEDADVAVDGQYRGKLRDFSRRKALNLAPGTHTVTVTYQGRTFTQVVRVGPAAPRPVDEIRVPL